MKRTVCCVKIWAQSMQNFSSFCAIYKQTLHIYDYLIRSKTAWVNIHRDYNFMVTILSRGLVYIYCSQINKIKSCFDSLAFSVLINCLIRLLVWITEDLKHLFITGLSMISSTKLNLLDWIWVFSVFLYFVFKWPYL